MRLNISKEQTIRGGSKPIESNVHKTTINNTIFRIVTKGLYIRPIEAIVREISTNALDGHIAAGKPEVPFHVTLPSKMNPNFIVRDFGCSMDNKTVFNVYGILGESTKNSTSNSIGGWGVGGKSPAAYTDTFFITTYKDGIRRIYQSSSLQNTTPLELLLEDITDNPDGVEVKVPVKEEDFYRFNNAAKTQLAAFDVKPTILNRDYLIDFEYRFDLETARSFPVTATICIPDDEGNLVDKKTTVNVYESCINDALAVRMGCVVYPINVTSEFYSDYSETLNKIEDVSGVNSLLLDLPVDSVDIKPSREDLDYTERTNDVLNALMSRMFAHYRRKAVTVAFKARHLPFVQKCNFIVENSPNEGMLTYLARKIKSKTPFSKNPILLTEIDKVFNNNLRRDLKEAAKVDDIYIDFVVTEGEKAKKMGNSDTGFRFGESKSIAIVRKCPSYIKKISYWSEQGELPESGLYRAKQHYNHYYNREKEVLSVYTKHEAAFDKYLCLSDAQIDTFKPVFEKYYENVEIIDLEDIPKAERIARQSSGSTYQPTKVIPTVAYSGNGRCKDIDFSGTYSFKTANIIKNKYLEGVFKPTYFVAIYDNNYRMADHNLMKALCVYLDVNVAVFKVPQSYATKLVEKDGLEFCVFDTLTKNLTTQITESQRSELSAQYLTYRKYEEYKSNVSYRGLASVLTRSDIYPIVHKHFFKFLPDVIPSEVDHKYLSSRFITKESLRIAITEGKSLAKRVTKRVDIIKQNKPTLTLVDGVTDKNIVIQLLKFNFKGIVTDENN